MWTWEQKGLILAAVFMLHISCYGGLSEMSSKPSLHKSNSDFSCYQYHNLVSIKVNKKLRFTNYRCIFLANQYMYIICHTGSKKYLLQVYQRIPRGSGYPIPRRRSRFSQYRPHCRTLVKTVQYEIWMFLASHDLKLFSYIGFIVLNFRRAKDFCLARICGGIVAIFIVCNLPRLAIGGFEVARYISYVSTKRLELFSSSLQYLNSLGYRQYCSALRPTFTTSHQSLRWSKLGHQTEMPFGDVCGKIALNKKFRLMNKSKFWVPLWFGCFIKDT